MKLWEKGKAGVQYSRTFEEERRGRRREKEGGGILQKIKGGREKGEGVGGMR